MCKALDFERFRSAVKWRMMNEGPVGATALVEAKGVARNGRPHDQRDAHIFSSREEKIASVHELFDTRLTDDALGSSGKPHYACLGPFAF